MSPTPLFFRLIAPLLLGLLPDAAIAEPQPGADILLRRIDGENAVGEHFALAPRSAGTWTGFFYLADEGRLVAASCAGSTCSGGNAIGNSANDRGRHVSAATRSALSNRPFAAYYDADAGDLLAVDCLSAECTFSIERVLDSVGDVGLDTAVVIDPASGFPLVSYYDAGNGDLKLHRCSSAACDTGAAVVVDASGDRGRRSSMAFAGATLWIGYEDSSTGTLRLASASAPYASFSVVDLGAGAELSLTSTAGGLLELVWRNTADDSLSRVRCADALCLAATQSTLAGAGRGHRPSAFRMPGGDLLVAHHEPATSRLHGTLCVADDCVAIAFDDATGGPGRLVAGATSTGLPIVHYADPGAAQVRLSRCTSVACTAVSERLAYDGVPAGNVRLAMRPDGVPVLAYIRERRPWLALCADPQCASISRRVLPGLNSDTRPALAIRPDGRAFSHFSSVGGSQAFDCSDASCSDGELREVSGNGNSTSEVMELALRADGRPVLLYTRSNLNDVYLFVCADIGCGSGSSRLVADEPSDGSTWIATFAVAVGQGNRPVAMYSRNAASGGGLQFVRCDDSECASITARSVGTASNLFATPLAIRSDGRPVFIESNFSSHTLAVCGDADCSTVARHPLPGSGVVTTLRLMGGDWPVFESTSGGSASVTQCADPLCEASETRVVMTDSEPGVSYRGSLGLGSGGDAFVALEEGAQGDIVLMVPVVVEVFRNGFE